MPRRRWILALTGVALVAVLVTGVGLKVRRDHEWAHGGDSLRATAKIEVATADTFPATVAALGGPSDAQFALARASSVVVRVSWNGPTRTGDSYQLLVLDRRVTPPRPLPVHQGWNARGSTGSHWSGSYEVLAERYDWLARTASVQVQPGTWTSNTMAIDAPADARGQLIGTFVADEGQLPFDDPSSQVLVALFLVDKDGDVRWAKRIAG